MTTEQVYKSSLVIGERREIIFSNLGGLHGQHWNSFAQAQGIATYQSSYANQGTLAALANQQSQYNALAQQGYATNPPTIEDAGFTIGEIVAWRCWRWSSGLLKSMAVNTIWAPNEPMDGDVRSLGVHAFKKQRDAIAYGLEYNVPSIVGQIKLWGEVIEHQDGYRAEFGAIESLDLVINKRFWKARTLRTAQKIYLHS